MSALQSSIQAVVGGFEVDERAGELRKNGLTIRLPQQLFHLLLLLMERPGQVVTREEIQRRLWAGRSLNFDDGINSAIKRIRQTLQRSGITAQLIETIPGHGYRFQATMEPITTVQKMNASASEVLGPCLAVMPLQNLSGNSADEPLAAALTDALVTSLAKIPQLRVKLWSGALSRIGYGRGVPAVAAKMGLDALLLGTLVRSGNCVRISVQLVNVGTEEYLWAESYDYKFRDLLAFHADLGGTIVDQVASKLIPRQQNRAPMCVQKPRPAAYQAFLKGHYAFKTLTDEGLWKAQHYWKKAIREDPGYARAYAGLAESYNMLAISGLIPASQASVQAREASRRALEIDEALSKAHTALGFTLMLDWDWDASGREFRRALQLDPNLATGNPCHYVEHLLALDRPETAISELERAQEFQPLSLFHSVLLGWTYYASGQFDRAIRQHRRVLTIDPHFGMAHWCLGMDYTQKKRYTAAIESFHAARLLGGSRNVLISIGYAYAKMGETDRARQVLKELKKLLKSSYSPPYGFAAIYAGLGEANAAFEWLARAYEAHDVGLIWLKWDPRFENLCSDQRFSNLLHDIGLGDRRPSAHAAD